MDLPSLIVLSLSEEPLWDYHLVNPISSDDVLDAVASASCLDSNRWPALLTVLMLRHENRSRELSRRERCSNCSSNGMTLCWRTIAICGHA